MYDVNDKGKRNDLGTTVVTGLVVVLNGPYTVPKDLIFNRKVKIETGGCNTKGVFSVD